MSFAYQVACCVGRLKDWNSFENAANDLLLSQYVANVNLANYPKIREVKDVQPPLERFFNELLPLAYPSRDIRDLRVGRIEYMMDAQITDCRSQNIFIFNGITDLSIIYTPLEVSIGGGEIKFSKSELATGPDLNLAGKKSCCTDWNADRRSREEIEKADRKRAPIL